MKNRIRTASFAVFLCLISICSVAQLSDLHYLPPLKQKGAAFTQQLISLSTPETTPFSVNVYRGTSTTPLTTLTVSKATGATYNPGDGDNNITLLTDANTGSVQSNSGLRFESPGGQKFYVNWRGKSVNQASSLTSKGRAAFGTAFKWVGAPNRGTNTSVLSNAVGIMATQDNTTVNIFGYDPACTFRLGATEAGITADALTVTLNKGQSYVLEASVNASNPANRSGWIGASITSNNPVAVNFAQMHFQPRTVNSQDCGIDQIIPENTLGKEYIFVRGNGTDSLEFPVIIATQNDTKIFVNGGASPIATINNGDYFQVPSTYYSQTYVSASVPGANMYIRTSKEAYAVQSLAGAANEATADLNFIAPVNCLLANVVDNIPDVSNIAGLAISAGISIIASSAISDADIIVKYGSNTVPTSTLTAARKTLAGSADWKTYYLSGLSGNVSVSANGPIAVGYFGFSGVAGASGYFSGFETIPTITVQRTGDGCLPGTMLTATPGFTAYTWYRDGELVPGINSNTYIPDVAGKFTVTVTNGSCAYSSANQYIYDCSPEIIVNTTANKSGILSGETVTFEVSVRYLGELNVNDLVLTNLVPSNVTVTGTSATYGSVSNSGSTYTWNIGTMHNGEEHLLNITATGNSVVTPTAGTLTVSKTQTITGTESNKVPDDFTEEITVYSALATEPAAHPTGLYFTNTGSAHPYNNVLHFTASPTASGYLVVRKTGTEPSFVPVDGAAYSTGTISGNEIIYSGPATTITDLSSSPLTDYYYTIYPYNGGGAATNYLLSSPLKAVINNRTTGNFGMNSSSVSSSAGLADQGVTVTFVNGVVSGGTTVTATRHSGTRPDGFLQGLPSGLNSVKNLFYAVSSSAVSPGSYVIALDFSSLGMSEIEWNDARVLKRSGPGSNWAEITGNVIDRKADGLVGKLVISGLSSFSEFAIGSTESTLPLTWVDFRVKLTGRSALLEWETANERGTKDFIVQHSTNSVEWYDLGAVNAQASGTGRYSFLHQSPSPGLNYYRLMQRDADGRSSFSMVKNLKLEAIYSRVTLLGNPLAHGILKMSVSSKMRISIRSIEGKELLAKVVDAGVQELNLSFLPAGTYLLVADNERLKFIR